MGRLILDCDDVLLDWSENFRRWLGAEHGITTSSPLPTDEGLSAWTGQSEAVTDELVAAFNTSEGFGRLSTSIGTALFIYRARDAGHSITVLTSCGVGEETIRLREENLRHIFVGRINDVICLPVGECKGPALAQMLPGIFVEDSYRHACSGADAGHKTFVLRRPWNRAREASCQRNDLTWIDDWAPIAALIC